MRMWMVNPLLMCKKHINGEHNEIHKHRHNFVKKHSMAKRILLNQIEPKSMKVRHDELSLYIKHNSPYEMPDISYLTLSEQNYKIDTNSSFNELMIRCKDCRDKLIKIWM